MSPLKHQRRPQQQIARGEWSVKCDCGWEGRTGCMEGARVKANAQVQQELETLYRAHLPAAEQRSYVLIDNRKQLIANPGDDGDQLIEVVKGSFVMPIGDPVKLISHSQQGGVHFVVYLDPETGETGELPVGEIRTAHGRVFKIA